MAFKLVAVTGASGFIGSYIIRDLLQRGIRVRALVRDPSDASKTDHLKALPGADTLLEFAKVDILDKSTLVAAFEGCDGVMHAAAVARLASKNPEEDIVKPALEGTRNALEAAEACGVRRFILTSSIAAVGREDKLDHSEADWTDSKRESSPYPWAKAAAEKLLTEKKWPFSVAAILPGLTIGPPLAKVHLKTSPSVVSLLLKGAFPMAPPLYFAFVDVRDVARAHGEALVNESFSGRCIAVDRSLYMPDVCATMKLERPELSAKVPRRVMWKWVIRALSYLPSSQLSPSATDSHLKCKIFSNTVFKGLLGTPLLDGTASLLHTIDAINAMTNPPSAPSASAAPPLGD